MKKPPSEGSDTAGYAEDPPVTEPLSHQQQETLDALSRGEITDFRISQKLPIDEIVNKS